MKTKNKIKALLATLLAVVGVVSVGLGVKAATSNYGSYTKTEERIEWDFTTNKSTSNNTIKNGDEVNGIISYSGTVKINKGGFVVVQDNSSILIPIGDANKTGKITILNSKTSTKGSIELESNNEENIGLVTCNFNSSMSLVFDGYNVINDIDSYKGSYLKITSKNDELRITYLSIEFTSLSLEQQETENGDSIRYVATISNVDASQIASWTVEMTLEGQTEKNIETFSTIYKSVSGTNGKEAKDNTYYLVATLTGIPSKFNGKILSTKIILTLVDGTTLTSNSSDYTLAVKTEEA